MLFLYALKPLLLPLSPTPQSMIIDAVLCSAILERICNRTGISVAQYLVNRTSKTDLEHCPTALIDDLAMTALPQAALFQVVW